MNTKNVRKRLYDAVDEAARALKLEDGLRTLLRELIHRIPDQAPEPISPASPGNLANDLNISERAIRSRVKKLLDLGLVRDRRLANGRRCVKRDQDRRIISIAGLDLTPLLERKEKWAEQVAVMKAARQEHRRLRHDISRKRRALSVEIVCSDIPEEARALWASLPRRLADLSLDALQQLVDKLDQLADLVSRDRKTSSGRPEDNGRQYTTNQDQSESCSPPVCAENRGGGETFRSGSTCGLEKINFRQVMMAAPEDWRVRMESRQSWPAFVDCAYERMEELGINPSTWAIARRVIGDGGAAIIIMLADAMSVERGGEIRSVGGWARRMAERAADGTANLDRSIYGLLLHEKSGVGDGGSVFDCHSARWGGRNKTWQGAAFAEHESWRKLPGRRGRRTCHRNACQRRFPLRSESSHFIWTITIKRGRLEVTESRCRFYEKV